MLPNHSDCIMEQVLKEIDQVVLVYLIDMVSVSGASIDKLNHEVAMHAVEPWQTVL